MLDVGTARALGRDVFTSTSRALVATLLIVAGCSDANSTPTPANGTDASIDDTRVSIPADVAPADVGDAGPADVATGSPLDIAGWTLVFDDEFDGDAVDTKNWMVYSGEQGNAPELNKFDPPNVTVSGGQLHLKVEKRTVAGHPYACGGLENPPALGRTFGRWVVRARFPKGNGYVGYLGLFGQGSDVNYKEVDFGEVSGSFPRTNAFTQHWGTSNSEQHVWSGVDSTADFHEYTVIWEPGKLTWLIDGKEEHTMSQHFTAEPMLLAMGDWASRCEFTWFGCPDTSTPTSSNMDIDYVRIYQKK